MNGKCYCWIFILCVLTGVWSTPVFLPEAPVIPEGIDPVKHYIMKEKSTADYASYYWPSKTGKCTNGNIIIGGYRYSDDNGVTWKTPTGNADGGVALLINGNDVYKVTWGGDGYYFWKSTDGGVSFSSYGIGSFSTSYVLMQQIGIAICTVDSHLYYVTNVWDSGAPLPEYYFEIVDVDDGDTDIVNLGADSAAGDSIKRMYYDAVRDRMFLAWYDVSTLSTKIFSFDPSDPATNTHEFEFNDIDGAGENLFTSHNDDFIKIGNYYYICGQRESNNNGVLLRSSSYQSGWEIIANEQIIPIAGTSPRLWGYVYDSNKIYLSHNGYHFFPICYKAYDSTGALVNSTWEGGVEVTNSDRGFGGFDAGKFYTMQEATWNDIFSEESLKIYAGSEPGQFKGLVDASSKTRFIDGMVLCIFDDAGTILFEGKLAFTDQDEGLYSLQAVEISEELERIKPTGTYTAQTAAQILVAMINTNCTFCYQSSSIFSSATTYTIEFKGEKSLAQILDEFASLEDYIWYKHGDGKIAFNDGTTASGMTYDATSDDFAEPHSSSEGFKIANRIEGRGKVEADGPVFYAADDLDDQTRNGVWIYKFTQPTWGYTEVKAHADNLLAARKAWSDIFSMLITETLTLRPGTTIGMSNFSTDFGIDDGTYILMAIEHPGDGTSRIVLNNNSLTSKDWAREQEYAVNAMRDLYTKSDITESAGTSTEVPFEAEDELLARIIRHATSEANAITIIYDSTHSIKFWIDSSGNLQTRAVANAALVFDQPSGNALVYIKATGGAGTEDVWLYLDAEDDSAILFQENGATKGYVKWDKGLADLVIDSAGDINLTPASALRLNGNDIGAALMIGAANAAWVPCALEIETVVGKVKGTGLGVTGVDTTDSDLQYVLPLPTNRGGLKLYVNRLRYVTTTADADDFISQVNLYGMATGGIGQLAGTTNHVHAAAQTTVANADLTVGALPADCSGYDAAKVDVRCGLGTTGQLVIVAVLCEVYYA